MNKNSPRYNDMKKRLSLLTASQLRHIIDALENDEVCLDTYNYEAGTGRFCPLAIAFNIPTLLKTWNIEPRQDIVLNLLRLRAGEAWGTVKGLAGDFYTDNRSGDLKELCLEILGDNKFESCRES